MEIELKPKNYTGDRLYINKRGDKITFSATIDGAGNDFVFSVSQMKEFLKGGK